MLMSFLDAAVPDIIETSGGGTLFVIILAVVVAAAGTLIWLKTKKAHDSHGAGENMKDGNESEDNKTDHK